MLGGYLAFVAHRFRVRATDPLVAWANLVGLTVALFFFALMLGPANPFRTLSSPPINGTGPNPLLQDHPLMAFHPPLLYLGLVGFTVPFMFAIAGLITGRFGEGWLTDTRRATLFAWGCLSVGIILGAWWSYAVLGWGGFWAWDPVEAAALLPWLTATAFLHSVIVQERRGMLRVWNLSLIISTFCLTILATFLTRSGVLNSVHSFTVSDIGPWLLTFLAVAAAVGIALIAWRGDRLRSPGRIDTPVSREVGVPRQQPPLCRARLRRPAGNRLPRSLAEALQGHQVSVGEPYFNRMTTPLGLALLFFMAVAPALPWRATSTDVLRRRLIVPAYVGERRCSSALALGTRGITPVLAFGLGAFAIAGIVRQYIVGVRARHQAKPRVTRRRRAGPSAATRASTEGSIVHVGIVCIAVALALVQFVHHPSATWSWRGANRQPSAATRHLPRDPYATQRTEDEHQGARASDPPRGQRPRRVRTRRSRRSRRSNEGIGTPSIRTGLLRDVYLTLVSSPNQQGRITIGVDINAMVIWLWIGGLILALGTAVALVASPPTRAPAGRRARPDGSDPRAEPPEPRNPRWSAYEAPGPVGGARRRVRRGGARDRPGHPGENEPPGGRIQPSRLVGQRVPTFTVAHLRTASRCLRASLAGKAVIVNFWNSWCIPCQQELPALKIFAARACRRPERGVRRDPP